MLARFKSLHYMAIFYKFIVMLLIGMTVQSTAGTSSYPFWLQKIQQSTEGLSTEALTTAFNAWRHARASDPSLKEELLTVVDYSLPSSQKRLWILDPVHGTTLLNTWVAHGAQSGAELAHDFSNQVSSHKSSIGVYKTADTYIGHNGYSLHLIGLDQGFNDHVYERSIVVHGSKYVSKERAQMHRIGRSYGCLAVQQDQSKQIIDLIKKGSIIVAYYPDEKWLKESKFL